MQHKSQCQYLCSVCGKSFENSQFYKEHRCKRFLCRECIESFETKVELTAHMKMHSAPIHCVIPSCREKTYTSKLMLRDHIFNKHTKQVKFRNGKQPWLCLLDGFSHICSGSYNGRFKILRHISSVAQYKPFMLKREFFSNDVVLSTLFLIISAQWQETLSSKFRFVFLFQWQLVQ